MACATEQHNQGRINARESRPAKLRVSKKFQLHKFRKRSQPKTHCFSPQRILRVPVALPAVLSHERSRILKAEVQPLTFPAQAQKRPRRSPQLPRRQTGNHSLAFGPAHWPRAVSGRDFLVMPPVEVRMTLCRTTGSRSSDRGSFRRSFPASSAGYEAASREAQASKSSHELKDRRRREREPKIEGGYRFL